MWTEIINNSNQFLTIGLICIIAEMTPGQDFILVARNSLVGGRKTGIYTAFGMGIGVIFHTSFILFLLSYIKNYSSSILEIIRYFGIIYLVYLGISSIIKDSVKLDPKSLDSKLAQNMPIVVLLTPIKGFVIGIISSILNPFTAIFFMSTIGLVADLNAFVSIKLFIILEAFIICTLWLCFVSFIFSNQTLKTLLIEKLDHWINKIAGLILLIIAIKIFFSKI